MSSFHVNQDVSIRILNKDGNQQNLGNESSHIEIRSSDISGFHRNSFLFKVEFRTFYQSYMLFILHKQKNKKSWFSYCKKCQVRSETEINLSEVTIGWHAHWLKNIIRDEGKMQKSSMEIRIGNLNKIERFCSPILNGIPCMYLTLVFLMAPLNHFM